MVVRRIRMLLDVWDATSIGEQEATIGRRKASGAPLGARNERTPADLNAITSDGAPVIPSDAHIRLAAASSNGGVRIHTGSAIFACPPLASDAHLGSPLFA